MAGMRWSLATSPWEGAEGGIEAQGSSVPIATLGGTVDCLGHHHRAVAIDAVVAEVAANISATTVGIGTASVTAVTIMT